MRAYIETKVVNRGFVAMVVTEDDYHDRGAHANSHQTGVCATPQAAVKDAAKWAKENGLTIVTVDSI